jgi:hypothetical protein
VIVEVPISRTEGHPRGEGYRLAVRCPWGPLLDRLNVVAEADRRGLRPIGSGGYTGGPCNRALVETLLAGGDVPSSRVLLADLEAAALRGGNALPSVSTSWPGRTWAGWPRPGLGGRDRARGGPAHHRPGRHPGGGLVERAEVVEQLAHVLVCFLAGHLVDPLVGRRPR